MITAPNGYTPVASLSTGTPAPFSYSASGSAGCSIAAVGGPVQYASAGTCVVVATTTVATSTTDGDEMSTLDASSIAGTLVLTVLPASRSITLAGGSATVGDVVTLAARYVGGGVVTYALAPGSTAGCQLGAAQLTAATPATCNVVASLSSSGLDGPAVSEPATFTFSSPPVVVSPPPVTPPPPVVVSPPPVTPAPRLAPLTVFVTSEVVTEGHPILVSAEVSGALAGDAVSVARVTLTYTGEGGHAYGPSGTPPQVPGTYRVTPSRATLEISPSADAARYASTVRYVAGTLVVDAKVRAVRVAPVIAPARRFVIDPFPEGSYQLTPSLVRQVRTIAEVIRRDGYRHVTITGYTDNVFTPAFNALLDEMRARSVGDLLRSELQALGVRGVGLAETSSRTGGSVASNTTAAGRALNRRVVVVVTVH